MKFLPFQLILLSALLPLVVECAHNPLSYEFSTSLHTNYNLYWNKPSDGKICMAVEVDTLGWVGLGFSPNGGMVDSDIMMAWVIDGEVTITDRYAVSMSLPVLDEQQDFELVAGYEEGGKTVIQFCRKLQTCDERDRDILSGTTRVIFSWNDNDPNPDPTYHTIRGTKNVNFIGTSKNLSSSLPDNLQTIEFEMGNVTIPQSETTYWCKTFHFNQPANNSHVVKIGINIDPRTVQYVHHMILYKCPSTHPIVSKDCKNSTTISNGQVYSLLSCQSSVISAWAVGGTDIYFPLDAGVPIGPGEQFDTVLLEIHYNNPNIDAGHVDNSGFVWYYTNELRTHDIGILTMGYFLFGNPLIIPPRSEKFIVQGYCPHQCTSSWPHDINVIATFLHSHTAGTAMWTQIIRDNKEIGYLDMNLNYDFNYQDYLFNEDPIVLKPGDELILNCQYNTKDRNDFTIGGESTQEEMCLNFLYYYPRVALPFCLSSYRSSSLSAALDSFQCNDIDVTGSTTEIEWTDKIVNTFEVSQLIDPLGQVAYCGFSTIPVNIPIPGVDYEVFPNRHDTCGKYNGTYYPGGSTADYYYDCTTNESYFEPIRDLPSINLTTPTTNTPITTTAPTTNAPIDASSTTNAPVDSTASATSLTLLPTVMWLLAAVVLSLI